MHTENKESSIKITTHMKEKRLFTRNGGTPVIVSSVDDIKRSLGDSIQGFDDVVIDGTRVLARIGIDYVHIGEVQ